MTRILVVDDEAAMLLTLAANLELAGLEVVTADSGKRAMEILREQSFDLVLSDIRMPGISGVELFRHVRELHPGTPVILMTAFTLDSLLDEAVAAGAYTVLSKPFDPDLALAVVLRAARRPSVLVLDHDAGAAAELVKTLTGMGLAVRAAPDEKSALEALGGGAVDVCLLDLALAVAGDPPLVSRLRTAHPGVAVIGLSADRLPELMLKAASSGMAAWLGKPAPARPLAQAIVEARRKGRR